LNLEYIIHVIHLLAVWFVVAGGILGFFASLFSIFGAKREIDLLERMPSLLVSRPDASRNVADLDQLLAEGKVGRESHAARTVRLVVDAASRGKWVGIDELHVFVGRREKLRGGARWGRWIRSILVLVGIVGTLTALKPILGHFSIDGTLEGSLSGTPDAFTSQKVVNMVRDLGEAFWPSLVAIALTVFISIPMAFYEGAVLRLHQALDEFWFSSLSAIQKKPELLGELTFIGAQLSSFVSLTEKNGAKIADDLEGLAGKLEQMSRTLDQASARSMDRVSALADVSASMEANLERYLGRDSHCGALLAEFIGRFGGLHDQGRELQDKLVDLSGKIESSGKNLDAALDRQSEAVAEMSKKLVSETKEAAAAARLVKKDIVATLEESFKSGSERLEASAGLLKEGAETFKASIASADQSSRDGIDKLVDGYRKDLNTGLVGKLGTCLEDGEQLVSQLRNAVDESRARLETDKRSLSVTFDRSANRLDAATGKAAIVAARLEEILDKRAKRKWSGWWQGASSGFKRFFKK